MAAGMTELAGEALCSADHGLSLAGYGDRGAEARTVLFDAGPDPYALERNGRAMHLDFGRIEALVLSHGHFDHSEGLLEALEMIRVSNSGQPVPLHVHPGAFVKRGLRLPSGEFLPFQDVPPRHALENQGARVLVSSEAEEILDGLFSLSGEIPRRSFERGFQTHYRQAADGQWESDPWIMDERFLAAHVQGKGIAIFTGCFMPAWSTSAATLRRSSRASRCTAGRRAAPGLSQRGHHPGDDRRAAHLRPASDHPGTLHRLGAVHALIEAFGEEIVDPLAVGSRQTL